MNDDVLWCREALPGVSRTFALGIELLAEPLRDEVGVAYLVCRVLDTVEDTTSLAAPARAGLLERAAVEIDQACGKLELITTAATHGFLPLLSVSEVAVRNQINVGIKTFRNQMGMMPRGFWLPECGYYPGLESYLKNAGIHYFFVDTHSVLNASEPPVNGIYAPLTCENGVAAFARDPESSEQVWSSKQGYPGDFDYRVYYRDIGFDLDLDYIVPYILDEHIRTNTGIKYYRMTGEHQPKDIYDPKRACAKAELHARDYIHKRQQQIDRLAAQMDRPP